MSGDAERALQKALIDHLRGEMGIRALLGDPARVWDEPPARRPCPHLLLGRAESRPWGADGGGVEHVLTLTCVSRFGGAEEAKAVVGAVRAALENVRPPMDGGRIVSLRVTYADVFRGADWRVTYGVLRVRAVTEQD